MDEELQQRVALNEAVFREVNEKLSGGHWPGDEDSPLTIRCECAQLGCSRMIELSAAAYEAVRTHPRRFLVVPGHEMPGAEAVVERESDYLVVEKRDEAGRLAEETDPRD